MIRSTQKNNLWVFDIDGVLTDPISKKVDNPAIFSFLNKRLSNNIPVLLNTGRSSDWVIKNICKYIDKKLSKKMFFCVCEMGAVILKTDQDGNYTSKITENNIIPIQLKNTVQSIVDCIYHDSMFVDQSKKAILTIEMMKGFPLEKYRLEQSKLKATIDIILKNYYPSIHIRPSSSTIAIDIKPQNFDKKLGAFKIYKWLNEHHFILKNQLKIICFGDSVSDMQMSDFFSEKGLMTEFVFVGESKHYLNALYPVFTTSKKYTDGALEYLQCI
ncbi:MAG: hypothetical protein COU63_02905 [Candidatus Pacebacteria bacterium CG10_big_fil_rev_8_21_14_0_10_36_11]|nr:hypothetical protein [Candidatus Pacearchaeota archaeon]OIP74379.1 MAG: hypothetical protein AUK08_01165 [Candidatus Pacebacteria bacterium CG2_30_36_39]PIR64942.1 MAG: hypothetical protein COU63_02905 [Candidatus Pacebacteria bacterium CG10_big_fil_rev_8_21_14_0_10_36_11]PJC43032.1 MAG: hypothetical protein CO040_01285 [Candidatus Pacebacteria bacterium CG_4_9_14_0_2_um_filter_36_8]